MGKETTLVRLAKLAQQAQGGSPAAKEIWVTTVNPELRSKYDELRQL